MGTVLQRLLLNQRFYNAGSLPPSPKGELYDDYFEIIMPIKLGAKNFNIALNE